jgi:hypothetical protein
MNRHEKLYRSTGRMLLALLALWIGIIILPWALPAKLRISDAAFLVIASIAALLFTTAVVVSVMRIVSYIRWTGKYPYYFLFRKSRDRVRIRAAEKKQSVNRDCF